MFDWLTGNRRDKTAYSLLYNIFQFLTLHQQQLVYLLKCKPVIIGERKRGENKIKNYLDKHCHSASNPIKGKKNVRLSPKQSGPSFSFFNAKLKFQTEGQRDIRALSKNTMNFSECFIRNTLNFSECLGFLSVLIIIKIRHTTMV